MSGDAAARIDRRIERIELRIQMQRVDGRTRARLAAALRRLGKAMRAGPAG